MLSANYTWLSDIFIVKLVNESGIKSVTVIKIVMVWDQISPWHAFHKSPGMEIWENQNKWVVYLTDTSLQYQCSLIATDHLREFLWSLTKFQGSCYERIYWDQGGNFIYWLRGVKGLLLAEIFCDEQWSVFKNCAYFKFGDDKFSSHRCVNFSTEY